MYQTFVYIPTTFCDPTLDKHPQQKDLEIFLKTADNAHVTVDVPKIIATLFEMLIIQMVIILLIA